MALHTGEVELRDGEYHGLVLHRASRMLTAAHGGQVLVSEATAGLLPRNALPDVPLSDLGVFRLRDVPEPVRLFQAGYAGMEPRAFPPLNADAGNASRLPHTFTRFFGREAEIAQLGQMLAAGETRLVTLTGPGGTGKTRLALETHTAAGSLLRRPRRVRAPGATSPTRRASPGRSSTRSGWRPAKAGTRWSRPPKRSPAGPATRPCWCWTTSSSSSRRAVFPSCAPCWPARPA
jgi:hypothetical protein